MANTVVTYFPAKDSFASYVYSTISCQHMLCDRTFFFLYDPSLYWPIMVLVFIGIFTVLSRGR